MSDYLTDLEKTLQSARQRVKQGRQAKALKAGAPLLFDIIDSEISLVVTRAFSEKPLDHDAYLSAHGEVKGIKRIRDLLTSKENDEIPASAEVTAIEENVKQLKDDQKQE